MKLSAVLLALPFAAPALAAVGKARVVNNCSFPVSVWSVGSQVTGPTNVAKNGGVYAETFTRDPATGGRAIKITLQPDGLYNGSPQTIFSYTLDGEKVWYDLSDVFGDAFAGKKLVEKSADATCPVITWPNGVSPGGSQVKTCVASKDVTLTLCAA
jgi:hypothetical protein